MLYHGIKIRHTINVFVEFINLVSSGWISFCYIKVQQLNPIVQALKDKLWFWNEMLLVYIIHI